MKEIIIVTATLSITAFLVLSYFYGDLWWMKFSLKKFYDKGGAEGFSHKFDEFLDFRCYNKNAKPLEKKLKRLTKILEKYHLKKQISENCFKLLSEKIKDKETDLLLDGC